MNKSEDLKNLIDNLKIAGDETALAYYKNEIQRLINEAEEDKGE